MSSLPTALRRQLESTCKQARTIAATGARKALEALAVHEPAPYGHMNEGQRELRRKLRAQARQLGDADSQASPGAYQITHLVEKLAYDQWHRLLFARFLLENNLLMSPEHGVSVSLEDCEELAQSLELKDAWAVAARFAAKELPQIFRADDAAGAVDLPVENRNPLLQLVTGLPAEVFTAGDSLGWSYQFWQAERKDEINAAGNRIGADELPAVTQLFTEDYMVDFLLDNTLGSWHAGKVLGGNLELAETAQSEEELRKTVSLPGCPWKYLRFIKNGDDKWAPAAGTFDGWPKTAKQLKCLDPCMGSGHFVVAMFERLVALRIAEERLDEAAAVAAVIRDNLFGLEIDPRCTQIGAFNLALAAWRRVGHCTLPAMNLACSGLAPNAKKDDWLKLAGDNERLRNGMEVLYRLFENAPVLGSLINPRATEGDLLVAAFHELQPLLERALAQERKDDTVHEMAVTAWGVAKAAELLGDEFTLVATNVPYLGRGKQHDTLKEHLEAHFKIGKADLATAFVLRCMEFCAIPGNKSASSASAALVTPQNWLFLTSFRRLREYLLQERSWNAVVNLGPNAFQDMNWWAATTALTVVSASRPCTEHRLFGLDTSGLKDPNVKAAFLGGRTVETSAAENHDGFSLRSAVGPVPMSQREQRSNPDARLVIGDQRDNPLLAEVATAHHGLTTGDAERMQITFWELSRPGDQWKPFCGACDETKHYDGRSFLLRWHGGSGPILDLLGSRLDGQGAWNRRGVLVRQMRHLPATLYDGDAFDNNTAVLVPHLDVDLNAIWAFISSADYLQAIRRVDQKVSVTSATLAKVPFDLAYWREVAAEQYPHGLPKPFSSDPTQWLFNGHPKGSDQPLHVAAVRLIGYQWPRQTGSSFPECPALGPDGLEDLADNDGIVCLFATKGEIPAAERLRGVLTRALGKSDLNTLLASAGPKGSKSATLEEWLREEFFEQHCEIFHHRPFIWHIWDGHKSGFSALLNYHTLTYEKLETLTYVYLGDWIRRQQAAVDGGEAGSDLRLQAAKVLQARLKLILEGEPPYDLFVRWKPLSKQAIGWHPDLNDGVRMNIRPFVKADVLRKRVKIKWEKDRGNEPLRDRKDFPWFWGWDRKQQDFAGTGSEPDGNRWNDCHYTSDFKRKAQRV